MPSLIPRSFSRWRTVRARGSAVESAMSAIRRRVGSAFAPAPAEHSTRTPRRTQAASSATCAGGGDFSHEASDCCKISRMPMISASLRTGRALTFAAQHHELIHSFQQ